MILDCKKILQCITIVIQSRIMSQTAVIHARIEPGIKNQAELILSRLGITTGEAIRMFFKQISLCKGIPFPLKIPNATTRKTLEDSRRGKNIERFSSLDEMFSSWDA